MPIKSLTVVAVLFSALLMSGPLRAKSIETPGLPLVSTSTLDTSIDTNVIPSLSETLSLADPASALARAAVPTSFGALMAGLAAPATGQAAVAEQASEVTDLRKALLAMAMDLRDIRYVRGGRDPSTGFDCSGFVRYVFAHAIGLQLPNNSASQFLAGLKVSRADMQPGDLVFFRTHGKRSISHVGIYISNGRFIHSPSSGKSVEISRLDEGYWAKRFAGAKRPETMAQVSDKG